jgi:hypothetical protein
MWRPYFESAGVDGRLTGDSFADGVHLGRRWGEPEPGVPGRDQGVRWHVCEHQ